ncbi:hypothetical protein EJB05_06029, partial [Eragrostis curvula]
MEYIQQVYAVLTFQTQSRSRQVKGWNAHEGCRGEASTLTACDRIEGPDDSRLFLTGKGLCTSSSSPHLLITPVVVVVSGAGAKFRSKSFRLDDLDPAEPDAVTTDTDSPSHACPVEKLRWHTVHLCLPCSLADDVVVVEDATAAASPPDDAAACTTCSGGTAVGFRWLALCPPSAWCDANALPQTEHRNRSSHSCACTV